MIKITIVGITGYSGFELFRLFLKHEKAQVVKVCATSHIGEPLHHIYPQIKECSEIMISSFDPSIIMQKSDVVFFATPAGVTNSLAIPFIEHDFPVIDLSGDFRLKNPRSYEKWYKKPSAQQEHLEKADYVLADVNTTAHQLISNPGCFATACLLPLIPLVKGDFIELDSIILDAKSGLSGAGKVLSESSHFVNVHDNMMMYKINQHQHLPEIVQELKKWNGKVEFIQFSTSLIPVNYGIFLSGYVKLKSGFSFDEVQQDVKDFYKDKKFVRIRSEAPKLSDVVGTNFCDIYLTYNQTTGIITIISVIDNLIKGAAGQAIQNFNHLFDIKEEMGLSHLARI